MAPAAPQAEPPSSGLNAWERKLWATGHELVVGTDEAGRGPLAGPVVAAAFGVLPKGQNDEEVIALLESVSDSKQMSEKQREDAYEQLTSGKFADRFVWAVGECSAAEIDEQNILKAALLAMSRSVLALPESNRPDLVLVDGCNRPPELLAPGEQWTRTYKKIEEEQRSQHKLQKFFMSKSKTTVAAEELPWRPKRVDAVIDGDARVPSISAASVLAKVHRDRLLEKIDKTYPDYGFGAHKGYGTEAHLTALRKLGPCPEHRRSFGPIREVLGLNVEPPQTTPETSIKTFFGDWTGSNACSSSGGKGATRLLDQTPVVKKASETKVQTPPPAQTRLAADSQADSGKKVPKPSGKARAKAKGKGKETKVDIEAVEKMGKTQVEGAVTCEEGKIGEPPHKAKAKEAAKAKAKADPSSESSPQTEKLATSKAKMAKSKAKAKASARVATKGTDGSTTAAPVASDQLVTSSVTAGTLIATVTTATKLTNSTRRSETRKKTVAAKSKAKAKAKATATAGGKEPSARGRKRKAEEQGARKQDQDHDQDRGESAKDDEAASEPALATSTAAPKAKAKAKAKANAKRAAKAKAKASEVIVEQVAQDA